MRYLKKFVLVFCFLLGACAQVPKGSVELSATVGRDLAEMKKSHLALVDIYYTGLIEDINMFIDNVYLPFQVQKTLADDIWKNELLLAIEEASSADPTGTAQKESLQKIEIFLVTVQQEVESYRKLKLEPVQKQYSSVYTGISRSYEQIHYANSIVTGHLASVVNVHESQNEILKKLDLSDMRTEVGTGLSGLSNNIDELIQKAKSKDAKLDSIITSFEGYLGQ